MYVRSSTPAKKGLMFANAVAVFDADYRGEYLMQLYNYTSETVEVPAFTRLAQLEFFPYLRGEREFGSQIFPLVEMKADEELYARFDQAFPSERGIGGIGSTG
jgi:dUTPase